MTYPTLQEYVSALRDASETLEQYKDLELVCQADGTPVMSSGNFAVVFKMQHPSTGACYALKCFHKDQEGRQESYKKIAEELEFLSSPFLLTVKYLEKELYVDSGQTEETEFPVLLMDWVEGQTLTAYLQAHQTDPYALALLCHQFLSLARFLLTQAFAHGDLKPDNILVRADGSLVLVDYDGMYVPAMMGEQARECGSPGYRHPLRTEEQFDEHIDDYPLALLALSLYAISLSPSLLPAEGADAGLLFSEADLRDISLSLIYSKLKALPWDETLQRLLAVFLLAQSEQNLSSLSFRLLDMPKPVAKEQAVLAKAHELPKPDTKASEEELAEGIEDEYGVLYSKDGKKLLKGDSGLSHYELKAGTEMICDSAFMYCSSLSRIALPSGLSSIGDWAFEGCESLSRVALPSGLSSIGDSAFAGCSSLREIDLPSGLTSIGDSAFDGCESLSRIELPASLIQMGVGALACQDLISHSPHFYVKDGLLYTADKKKLILSYGMKASYTILDSVTEIGAEAFYGCSSLREIDLPSGLSSIGDSAFDGCESLSEIVLPSGLKRIGDCAFNVCENLSEIVLPSGLSSIGDWAFEGCSSLREIDLPSGLSSIGDWAFEGCESLSRVALPSGLSSIGDEAFLGCSSLSRIELPASLSQMGGGALACQDLISHSPHFYVEDGLLYTADKKKLILAYGMKASYTILNSVTEIGAYAFDGCKSLSRIDLPSGLSSIGDWAFRWCSSLSGIDLPSGLKSIGDSAFESCRSLSEIDLPSGLSSIGDWAFEGCSSLSRIDLPSGLIRIGDSAFWSCDNLSRIRIPKGSRAKFEKLLHSEWHSILEEQ